jgi:hypothetical protein
MKALFVRAIHEKRKVSVTFYSREDKGILVRTCAPMDYGPSRRARRKNNRFHFWDYDSDTQEHVLSLNPGQVRNIEILNDRFDPAEFVTWNTSWFVPRDWGAYS